jgi:anti-anti-sigma factor
MSINIYYFKTYNSKHGNIRIGNLNRLTGKEAAAIREEIQEFAKTKFKKIYVDTKDVQEVDLSGINEIIYAHSLLDAVGKKIVLAYCENSLVQRWVKTTGLDRFVEVAIIPTSV